jgi:hypothetical protein
MWDFVDHFPVHPENCRRMASMGLQDYKPQVVLGFYCKRAVVPMDILQYLAPNFT